MEVAVQSKQPATSIMKSSNRDKMESNRRKLMAHVISHSVSHRFSNLLNQFNLAELFNPPRDYDVRPNNPPGRFYSWFHFLIRDFSEGLAATSSLPFFDWALWSQKTRKVVQILIKIWFLNSLEHNFRDTFPFWAERKTVFGVMWWFL